jgi:acetolactate synthase-1/2/3 large subunit
VPGRRTKEIPFRDLFEPVTKWTAIIEGPEQVTEIVRRAFNEMRSGRFGPVAIGLPYDVSGMPASWTSYIPTSTRLAIRSAGDPAQIKAAVDLVLAARSPYVYVGSGILWSEASAELVELSELLGLPVATTLNGKSAFPEDHALALGIGGFAEARYGTLQATQIAKAADVALTIGAGFKQHAALTSMPACKHIQVDTDASELNKHGLADVAILGDAKLVLRQMIEEAKARPTIQIWSKKSRIEEIGALRERWMELSAPLLTAAEVPVNPYRLTAEFMSLVDPDETIVLHDAGSVRASTCQHYVARSPRSFLGFGVQSAMGWSIGAAIGAKTGAQDKLVTAFIGEEAFAETALEIETSIRGSAPVLIIVLNNRQFTDRDGGVSAELAAARFHGGIDICAVSSALGAKTFRIETPDMLRSNLLEAIACVRGGTTAVVEVLTKRVKTNLANG